MQWPEVVVPLEGWEGTGREGEERVEERERRWAVGEAGDNRRASPRCRPLEGGV